MRILYNFSSSIMHPHRLSTAATAFALLFLFASASTTLSTTCHQLVGGLVQQREETRRSSSGSETVDQVMSRRRLGRLGSAPPTCRSKCGRCSPCKPVHVPIQPGRSMTLEYYPEAWRCKCGNKLFMP